MKFQTIVLRGYIIVSEKWQFDTECDKIDKYGSIPREVSESYPRRILFRAKTDHRYGDIPDTLGKLLFIWSTDFLNKHLAVPEKWEELGPQFITNSE